MQFSEVLKLRSKLFFLFILITIGLISVGVMGTLYVNSMKKNMDALYFGSLVPVTELNSVIQTYHIGLANTVNKATRGEISTSEAVLAINHSLKDINQKWHSYMSHFKRDDEMEYVEYTDMEIEATNKYFMKIVEAINAGKDISNLSISILEKKVATIHYIIQKLINYEVRVARYERVKFLDTYNSILVQIGIILTCIIFTILGVLMYVFRSIQSDHTKLEIAAKKLKEANKKLENASYTDSLTGLHNRRYFNFIFDRELKRARRNKTYITFMMIDIDYFKQYNDTYGHLEGDNALKLVSKALQNTLKRPTDYIFRLGGEEFGVLLSETDEQNSLRLAENISKEIRSYEIKHENSEVSDLLTVSIGIVNCIADNALENEQLIARADEMLYEAKKQGRDRSLLSTEISSLKRKSVA